MTPLLLAKSASKPDGYPWSMVLSKDQLEKPYFLGYYDVVDGEVSCFACGQDGCSVSHWHYTGRVYICDWVGEHWSGTYVARSCALHPEFAQAMVDARNKRHLEVWEKSGHKVFI